MTTPEDYESLCAARDALERHGDKPRDKEEAAAFKGMGHAITIIRERCGLSREEVALTCEMTVPELEALERGEVNEWWGGLRKVAQALGIPLPALIVEAEEFAPGPGDEAWRRRSGEAGSHSTASGARSDDAENRKRT